MLIEIATTRGNNPEAHKAGCADVRRGLSSGKYQGALDAFSYQTRYDVVAEWWGDIIDERLSEAEYMVNHPDKFPDAKPTTEAEQVRELASTVKFAPCTDGLPAGDL